MVCASCGQATKAGARFCGGCGASLAQRCPACGAEIDPATRFCETCGAPLRARPADGGETRKVVTVVFADLIGSTALHERLDPESVSRIMAGYHRSVRAPVEAHGGTVVQLLGDGVMCAFGVPRVAEDDALRAVRAGVDIQRSFREFVREHGELAGRVGLRVAVNTGEVVVSDDYAAGIGDPLNVAARLQQEAKDGDVLLGEATQRLVAERVTLARVGSFAIKGRAEPVTAYRVVSLERSAAAATPFVGRDDEVRRLGAVYQAAVSAPAARLAVLLGSPGLGKSRLLDEFARQLEGRASVLMAQCNAAGGATFAPLAEALRVHLQLEAGLGDEALRAAIDARVAGDDAERARIANGIGALLAGAPESPEETFFVVRRLLSALAAKQPVVLVIDDLHWAEPLLLDFTEHLVQWGAGVPLLVLAAARPELRDTRSSFTTPGGLISDVMTLGGLDAAAATRLAANVIGADTLPATVAGRVLTTSEGNPLFLRELVRMLVSDGALRTEGDRWTLAVDLTKLEMPPTIQALLAARLERLRPEERLVLERAAVVGRQFSRAAVRHLLPREAHADLDLRLEALRRSELVEPDAGWLLGEPALRFHHVLIRDAAYRRVLRNTRAELHARFADWLESRASESAPHDETIGWHLEQAHQHLRELGPLDANGRALGERASRELAAAGRRALARDDLEAAGNLLGRALACLDDAEPARAELALDWCEALLAAGDVTRGAQAIAELGRFTGGSKRLAAWHTCFSGQLAALADPQALRASSEAVAAAAEVLASAGDVAGESKAHAVHADALVRLGMIGASEVALDKALAAARRVGDRRRANAVLAGVPLAVLWGPSPVTRASGRCLDVVRVLRITQGAPAVEAVALRCQAVLETLRGRSEAARRMIASSRRLVEELGITQRLLEADVFAGMIELYEGDAVAAEAWLRPAYEGFRAHGLGVDAARAAALLGRALLAQGRADEAEALSHESEALAGDDFKAAIAWRGVRAESLARRGEHAAAVELARAAVDIASATDDLLDHADARSALAVALRAAGRGNEADAEEARAIELWERKGATLLVERARAVGGLGVQAKRGADVRIGPVPSVRRRVRENAASASAVRIGAALAAGDVGALNDLLAPEVEIVHRPTGSVFDRAASLEGYRGIGDADGLRCEVELLATLGDALSLSRVTASWRSGSVDWLSPSTPRAPGAAYTFGAGELLELVLNEVDASGRRRRAEVFATDRLGDAVVRLYERYAELLPDVPERTRAAATARAVAAMAGPDFDPDRWAAVFAPEIEALDHRSMGSHSGRGADALLERLRAWFDLTARTGLREDDVLALTRDALVQRLTFTGADRVGGGAFELPFIRLHTFGADGLVTRIEWFDADRVHDALARFDELTAGPPTARPIRRRVRPNAALLDASIAAREADALATLGDSLALCRWSVSASGYAGTTVDVGAYERERIDLVEVDAQGKRARAEHFAADHLGDAIRRLYERYAELLPEGPERERAAATARSVSALPLQGPRDLDRFASVFAPSIRWDDPRTVGFGSLDGPEAVLRGLHALSELVDASTVRVDDIVALRPDALLVRWTHSAINRDGGGAVELQRLQLWVFGPDGLLVRWVQLDADRVDEALARLDELTTEPPAARPIRRRVRANAATAHLTRLDARVQDDGFRTEPLGTLGDSLVVSRLSVSGSRAAGKTFDVGAFENESVTLDEVDAHGRRRRREVFASGRLGDAIARLYERYAELLPDGPARDRAAATARSVATMLESFDLDRRASVFAPNIEFVDDRTVGLGPVSGAEAVLQAFRALRALTESWGFSVQDVLGLRSDALLVRWTDSGTLRAGGGAYERHLLQLMVFGESGLIERWHQFDAEQEGDALARFDALTAEPETARPIRRRVRPNAATAYVARIDAAFAARDSDALGKLIAEGSETIEHFSGTTFDRRGALSSFRALLSARDSSFRQEPLATLGDSLALCRLSRSAGGLAAGALDVGAFEMQDISLVEVDAQGHHIRGEFFALDRLGDAVTRLYERYAELLPAGPARDRAEATARAVANVQGFDLDRLGAALAPAVEFADHRALGFPRTSGAEAYLRRIVSMHEVADDLATRIDDVLALRADALLVRWTNSGTDRGGGGAFELPFLLLLVFGADGLVTHNELFDAAGAVEALARFDELTSEPLEERFANAAWRASRASDRAIDRRDWDDLVARHTPGVVLDDRRSLVRTRAEGEAYFAHLRFLFDARREMSRQFLATRGERLALDREVVTSAASHGGLAEFEALCVNEVDATGRRVAIVAFDPDDLDAAYAELDARYAAGEAARHAACWEAVQRLSSALASRDWEEVTRRIVPDLVLQDRRRPGLHELRSRDEYLASICSMVELAPDARLRLEHVLALDDRGVLAVMRWVGSREGGTFEIPFLTVNGLGADGRFREFHSYDLEELDEARARFAALATAPRTPWIENAATRSFDRVQAAWAARDWERIAADFAPEFHASDRRTTAHLELDRDENLAFMRMNFELTSSEQSCEVLATRGERLALARLRLHARADRDAGPSEIEFLILIEVNANGERVATVRFDPDDLDAAYAELDERYLAGEAAPFLTVAAGGRAFVAAVTARDWDSLATILAPDLVVHDHRQLGWETLHGPALLVDTWKALVDLAPDVRVRLDHAQLSENGSLAVFTIVGTHDGGAFEDPRVVVHEYDRNGKIRQHDIYAIDQVDESRARFEAIAT